VRQFHLSASPASITASDEPTVEVPTAVSPVASALKRSAMIETQRRSSSAVWGYSGASTKLTGIASIIRSRACGSIHVVTKEARLSSGLPFSVRSSWMIWYAASGAISVSASVHFGIGATIARVP
jgi:hypothetical protein